MWIQNTYLPSDCCPQRPVRFVAAGWAIVVLCLTGCQSWNPFSKPSAAPATSPGAQLFAKSEPAKPLTNDQKADVQLTIASSLESEGQFDEAVKIYEGLIKKNPKGAEAYHRLALAYDKKGDSPQAEKYYRLAIERDPKNADLLCDAGYNYYLQCRWPEAEAKFNQALKLNPNLARAHNNLGLVQAHTERHDLALASFQRAGCKAADAHANLGYCLLWDRQNEPAEKQFQLAVRLDPACKPATEGLARVHALPSQPNAKLANEPVQVPLDSLQQQVQTTPLLPAQVATQPTSDVRFR